jgi:hypothetical protein
MFLVHNSVLNDYFGTKLMFGYLISLAIAYIRIMFIIQIFIKEIIHGSPLKFAVSDLCYIYS